jgi:hypothetical protein
MPEVTYIRLSCQLIASGSLDGVAVHTPETQL